jgi:signal transduction histidine kinase
MAEHLRFSPDILSRLGEELIPDIDQGIIELVKNAYDADATECKIALKNPRSGEGSITITDNGVGMSADQIRQGWLVIGRSAKSAQRRTARFGRVPVGDKGLGRLAALRLGKEVLLRTRPSSEKGCEYQLTINWEAFDRAKVVEDVAIHVQRRQTTDSPGTEICISRIETKIGRTPVNKLARSLLLLSDPFRELDLDFLKDKRRRKKGKTDPGFKAELLSEQFSDLQKKVSTSYFSDADYRIHAELFENGTALFSILDWKGDALYTEPAPSTYDAPPFLFDVWVFILDSRSFSAKASTLGEVREWLKHVGGVHIYEDGIRVPPYGSPGNDWLDMNLKRARSPEMRPSTNTSVGRVRLSNAENALIQKTDRIGYIENAAFLELRRCCEDALYWAARVQVRERDKRRTAQRADIRERSRKAEIRLEDVLKQSVPVTARKKVDDAISLFVKETGNEAKALKEDLQLYRSLATAGMTSAVFAHEIGRPLRLIDNSVAALRRLVPAEHEADATKRIKRMAEAKSRLNSFVSIPLILLAKGKRRPGRTDVNACVEGLIHLIGPILEYYHVTIEVDLTDRYSIINGSEALIDGICLNLIMNSINAFHRDSVTVESRRIRVATEYDGSNITITVDDNAGGIDGVDLEDVWLPGVTTTPDGTGFGLTIVRDSVNDLAGSVEAIANTEFGGARFIVQLPPMRSLFG